MKVKREGQYGTAQRRLEVLVRNLGLDHLKLKDEVVPRRVLCVDDEGAESVRPKTWQRFDVILGPIGFLHDLASSTISNNELLGFGSNVGLVLLLGAPMA